MVQINFNLDFRTVPPLYAYAVIRLLFNVVSTCIPFLILWGTGYFYAEHHRAAAFCFAVSKAILLAITTSTGDPLLQFHEMDVSYKRDPKAFRGVVPEFFICVCSSAISMQFIGFLYTRARLFPVATVAFDPHEDATFLDLVWFTVSRALIGYLYVRLSKLFYAEPLAARLKDAKIASLLTDMVLYGLFIFFTFEYFGEGGFNLLYWAGAGLHGVPHLDGLSYVLLHLCPCLLASALLV